MYIRASRSPPGERGLKCNRDADIKAPKCRSPPGERGLKYLSSAINMSVSLSLPSRGARIEIRMQGIAQANNGRSPPGERGLKLTEIYNALKPYRRSPPGERGLK